MMGNYSVADLFFVVDVLDTNVVMGVQWLYSLGRVTIDWQKLEMEFTGLDGKLVVLRRMHSYPPQIVSAHRIEADLRHGDIEWAMDLRILETGAPTRPMHPDILALLERHQGVFGEIPLGRPPDRGLEHTIELEEGVHAVITTPYQHPKTYQDEFESAIQDLLRLGHIKPSLSPFTSSVVLVKKKNGTLHMCIDYRALIKKRMKIGTPFRALMSLWMRLRVRDTSLR